MATLDELANPQTQYAGAFGQGLDVLDLNQQVTFQVYTRTVLPIDGFVFWQPTVTKTFKGSLHYAQEVQQHEDETVGFATVRFTSSEQVQEFTDSPQNTLFVAKVGDFRFAFSAQQGLYFQTGIWHYFGHSVYPALASQLLDTPGRIDPSQAVTTNSLALWLQLNQYAAPFPGGFSNSIVGQPLIELFPSYMVPENQRAPYGVIHIAPDATRALQAVPYLGPTRSHYQLAADRVRVTLYGVQNNAACDFLDCVLQYSLMTENFGLMNTPIVMDGKRPQPEVRTIAMQKFIDFEVSYYQARVAQVARQMILKAITSYQVATYVAAP